MCTGDNKMITVSMEAAERGLVLNKGCVNIGNRTENVTWFTVESWSIRIPERSSHLSLMVQRVVTNKACVVNRGC